MNSKKHKWSPPSWLNNPVPGTILVHDEEVQVYNGSVLISDIKLYRENNRTTLDLQHLLETLGKTNIRDLSDSQTIDYILKQGLHKITDLAGSIKKNSVKVPLILTSDKELLDGNRRFLACQYLLRTEKKQIENFTEVPARALKPGISRTIRLKIISEENFLSNFKEPWPREVRAKFAIERYHEFYEKLKDEEEAYKQVKYFLDINKQDLMRFMAVLEMISEYVNYVGAHATKTKQDAERFARSKFHFFEEFYNKTCKGRYPIKNPELIVESNELLYKYILNEQLTSTLKVRELANIVRYDPTRKYLQKPKAIFEVARANYQDYARPKKAVLKITQFCEWLEDLTVAEKKEISKLLTDRLKEAVKKLN